MLGLEQPGGEDSDAEKCKPSIRFQQMVFRCFQQISGWDIDLQLAGAQICVVSEFPGVFVVLEFAAIRGGHWLVLEVVPPY